MKKNYFIMMLMAAGLMMSACGGQQKNDGKAVESDDTEDVATTAQSEDEEEFDAPRRGIDDIREVWTDKTIEVNAGNNNPGIKELTLAFCKTYPQCETNEALRKYLSSPDAASMDTYQLDLPSHDGEYTLTYDINCDSRNGYIRSMAWTQTDRFTYGCYWNRKNGHKLFAAFMDECWESIDWDQCLVVFYDYDPNTDIMTPEPALTSMIEKRMKDFSCYEVRLPEEGKDIEVHGIAISEETDEGEEDWESVELKLKWNGDTFDWSD